MHRFYFGAKAIASAGYDAQCALLEIEFATGREIRQYTGVPEELWYGLKKEVKPDLFFHRHIKGNYLEKQIHPAM